MRQVSSKTLEHMNTIIKVYEPRTPVSEVLTTYHWANWEGTKNLYIMKYNTNRCLCKLNYSLNIPYTKFFFRNLNKELQFNFCFGLKWAANKNTQDTRAVMASLYADFYNMLYEDEK